MRMSAMSAQQKSVEKHTIGDERRGREMRDLCKQTTKCGVNRQFLEVVMHSAFMRHATAKSAASGAELDLTDDDGILSFCLQTSNSDADNLQSISCSAGSTAGKRRWKRL